MNMNKISISETILQPKEVVQKPKEVVQHLESEEIKKERHAHELNFSRRLDEFQMILMNYSQIPFKYILYGFANVIVSLLVVSILTLIPLHNIITSPEYWYETMLQTLASCLIWVSYFVLNTSSWMNIKRIKEFRHCASLLLNIILTFVFSYSFLFVLWTYGLMYQWPLPYSGFVCFSITLVTGYISIWFRFDLKWRKNKLFRWRLKFFLLALAFSDAVGNLIYSKIIMKMFLIFPQQYQWSISIILPIVREINIWITNKLASHAASGDQQGMEIVVSYTICTRHAIFLAVVLGSIATTNTCIMILAVDFIINIYLSLRIIWTKKYKEHNTEKQTELLQELTINEIVEFFAPLTYLLCFVVAYYSPNSKLIGNIGNGYWHYQKVKDVGHVVENVFMFFAVDFISAIVCFLILWVTCRINLFRAWACLQNEFGLIFAINIAHLVNAVS